MIYIKKNNFDYENIEKKHTLWEVVTSEIANSNADVASYPQHKSSKFRHRLLTVLLSQLHSNIRFVTFVL